MQSLYRNAVNDDWSDVSSFSWLDTEPHEKIAGFAEYLVSGTKEHLADIDSSIQKHLKRWKMERIGGVEKAILRMSVFSILHQKEISVSIIVDEAQNLTNEQTLMVISRIGLHSNMVICGDVKQIDLKKRQDSGLGFLSSLTSEKDIGLYQLLENHRHPLVDRILDIYDKRDVEQTVSKIITLNKSTYKEVI